MTSNRFAGSNAATFPFESKFASLLYSLGAHSTIVLNLLRFHKVRKFHEYCRGGKTRGHELI